MTRLTVTLPDDYVQAIDRHETNRSRFIQDAVRRELDRRHQELLKQSLENPHPEAQEFADMGFAEWMDSAAPDDHLLVDPSRLVPIRWDPEIGWVPREPG